VKGSILIIRCCSYFDISKSFYFPGIFIVLPLMVRYCCASVGFGSGDCIVGAALPVDGIGFGSFSGCGSSI